MEAEGKALVVIKALVLEGHYDLSKKIWAAITDGDFGHEDLECCIASATGIHKIEPDDLKASTDGMKYTIHGRDTNGRPFYTCGKLLLGEGGRIYFFITAHEARPRR